MSDNKKGSRKRNWKPSYPYNVEYNDHFESPLQAYRDIQPLIDWVTQANPVLYDPYYCDGQTKKLLHTLGYENVVHEKRDFYLDIQNDSVPEHHVLVTNPPYSEEHKKKCLDYAFRRLKQEDTPFALLLPAYVATKSYFRQLLETHGLTGLVYLVPQTDYAYDHPEGTGKEVSPFRSMWFCGLPRGRHARVREFWKSSKQAQQQAHLYLSLAELEGAQVISTQHRPNPKQRKKKRKRMEQTAGGGGTNPSPKVVEKAESTKSGKEKSKYRDDSGKRKRRRF